MRPPDLTIGPADAPQTYRWHLWRWRGVQFALHQWMRSDQDRALHDHTANNISILLSGRYREWYSHPWEPKRSKMRYPLIPYFRLAETPHRIELLSDKPVWTIWIRFKARRGWGFYCRKGWRHWRTYLGGDYTKPGAVSTVQRGCD